MDAGSLKRRAILREAIVENPGLAAEGQGGGRLGVQREIAFELVRHGRKPGKPGHGSVMRGQISGGHRPVGRILLRIRHHGRAPNRAKTAAPE